MEISKIVFLIFHERLFQKKKNLYFCKDIVQDYSKVFTIVFYLIWLRRKSKISSRTIQKYLPICSISFDYGQNQKN